MRKPRPTARDRDLAAFVLGLDIGKHFVDVIAETGGAVLKPEGSCIIRHDGKVITIIPHYRSGFVKVKLV